MLWSDQLHPGQTYLININFELPWHYIFFHKCRTRGRGRGRRTGQRICRYGTNFNTTLRLGLCFCSAFPLMMKLDEIEGRKVKGERRKAKGERRRAKGERRKANMKIMHLMTVYFAQQLQVTIGIFYNCCGFCR